MASKPRFDCICGCGEKVWDRGSLKRGHPIDPPNVSRETLEVAVADPLPAPPVVDASASILGPPPDGSIDRRLWRLATDRPSTPKSNPWIGTRCHECKQPMWTKDPLSTWEKGGICEECFWILTDAQVSTTNQQYRARVYRDPFRPQ